ncbi:MAG: 2-hydroxyacid dehydrogenase [Frankiaceae bacterium]
MRAWVPWAGLLDGPDGPPAGVEMDVWAGGEPPESAEEVEFLVPPFFVAERADVLASLPKLRVVQTVTAGVDWVLPHLPAGVTLCDARGVHDTSTAEWAVAAMLAAVRQFPRFVRAQAEGRWDYAGTGELAGRSVLIVGYGSIGAAIERRLAPFEVTVLRVSRTGRDGIAPVEALPDLLPRADVVVLIVPLTAATRQLADAAFLARMKDGALLVNASRGPVVDTGALLAELRSGRLTAALDVTDPEPLPEGHPLWTAPGLLLTPHVAGSTSGFPPRIAELVRAQIGRYLAGEPLANVVSGEY